MDYFRKLDEYLTKGFKMTQEPCPACKVGLLAELPRFSRLDLHPLCEVHDSDAHRTAQGDHP